MGLTVTCARCHDHKFDPIAIKDDPPQLAAIFASTPRLRLPWRNGDPIQTPIGGAGPFGVQEAVERLNAIERKVAGIIDFDKDAQKYRDMVC